MSSFPPQLPAVLAEVTSDLRAFPLNVNYSGLNFLDLVLVAFVSVDFSLLLKCSLLLVFLTPHFLISLLRCG